MNPLIVLFVIGAYFALLLTIGAFGRRKPATRIPGPFVAFAMVGAAISGVTFVSVPGMAAAKGYSYLQMALGFIVGNWIIAYWLLPIFYRQKLVSIYGYLENRFGSQTYRSGAWLFFVSKISGAAVRFFVACLVLDELVLAPLGLPFEAAVALSLILVWLFTVGGGVKTVIWADLLRSTVLIAGVILSIVFIAIQLNFSFPQLCEAVANHPSSRIFWFDDPRSGLYFWKQFVAGVFMAVAMTGLDQDMMQRTIACNNSAEASKGLVRGGVMQFFLIALFLILGTLLLLYTDSAGMAMPEKSDSLFSAVACAPGMPTVVGILFVAGLVACAYSAAGSALTALTTSFSIDILRRDSKQVSPTLLRRVHIAMAAGMGLIIIVFYHLSNQDAISAVYILASYTYGPLLGLFALGLLSHRRIADAAVPVAVIAAPLLSWAAKMLLQSTLGYELGFELLLLNAFLTVGILLLVPAKRAAENLVSP